MNAEELRHLFDLLNDELRAADTEGELFLVGGAVMCLAYSARIGAEFHDEEDLRYLLRHLNITSCDEAVDTIGRYYPLQRFPQKTLYALGELLP